MLGFDLSQIVDYEGIKAQILSIEGAGNVIDLLGW